MGDDNNRKDDDIQAENIQDIMRARDRLDKILQTKFRKKMTIVFTDVCGYTHYMDTRGDISGRAWMQKHHDIVLPLIEGHSGQVLDIMGDGVMASFENSVSAVKACVEIQKGLAEYNQVTDPADALHVTIGANTGEILVDDDHIAGDVVNVASRIETKAEKDQILISKSTYEEVRGSEDLLCRAHGSVSVKGKSQPLELYRVIWQDEDIILDTAPRVRSEAAVIQKTVPKPLEVLQLEITREESRLKVSAYEQRAGEVSTVRHYEEIPVSIDKIGERCREIVETLNNTNRKGRLSRDVLVRLREIGQVFSDELFTQGVKEKIRSTKAEHLIVHLDDQLVQVPWELLHDGQQFLSQRFNMGRLVKTRQTVVSMRSRILERPLKMMVLADPKGDLKGAYEEGTQIRDFMDRERDLVSVSLRSDNITPDFIQAKIRNFDLVHFAGHSDYDTDNPGESGWRLSEGTLKANSLTKMVGTGTMPALIFSNACQSARTEEWGLKEYFQDEIFGLANAFILAGVKHYVGTFWEILDEPSRRFALEFYKNMLAGSSVGEALRLARLTSISEYGEETIVWASYLLYGDPTYNYMDQISNAGAAEEEALDEFPGVVEGGKTRAGEEVIDFSAEPAATRKSRAPWFVAAGIVALILVLLFVYPGVFKTDTTKYEQEITKLYSTGNFEAALTASKALEDRAPQVRLSYLIQGEILLRQGKLDQAQAAYQKAVQATTGTEDQKAKAFIGLGRIASLQKQTDKAMDFYQQANSVAPSSGMGYLPQAMLLDGQGNSQQALNLLVKAQEMVPNDRMITVMTNETRKKVMYTEDQGRQERVDNLVKDLLAAMDKPTQALPSDGWTSQPLSLWIMDFSTQGYTLQEGEDKMLVSGLTDYVLQHGRIELVERALLDKLMQELKLSTTNLVDRRTALSLGKIVAAKMLLSGKLVYAGPQTQVALRLIETETGRITAAVSETFPSAVTTAQLAEKLSGELLAKIEQKYPVRGIVKQIDGGSIVLNIGERAGVAEGSQYKVLNEETVLEIIAAQPDESVAKIVSGGKGVSEGQRVEEIR